MIHSSRSLSIVAYINKRRNKMTAIKCLLYCTKEKPYLTKIVEPGTFAYIRPSKLA